MPNQNEVIETPEALGILKVSFPKLQELMTQGKLAFSGGGRGKRLKFNRSQVQQVADELNAVPSCGEMCDARR